MGGLRVALVAAAVALAFGAGPGSAPAAPSLDAKAWLLIEARSGEELAGQDTARQLAIASATKMMTAHLALERLKLAEKLRTGRYTPIPGEVTLGLRRGERVTVRDLLLALMLPSANDAAVALARGVSGTVPRFVAEMNRSALALGLTDTHYSTPVGLDEPGNYSSAHDLGSLARRLLSDPRFARIVDTERATLHSGSRTRRVVSRNNLLLRFPWISGVKTGHTAEARHVLVASAERRGVELISVVLKAPTERARDADALELLRYGFGLYKPKVAVKPGAEIASPEVRYAGGELPLIAAREVKVGVRQGQRVGTKVRAPDEVEGPIRKGEKLGVVEVTVDGRPAGSAALVTAQGEPAATGWQKFRSKFLKPVLLVPLGLLVIVVGLAAARRRRGELAAPE